MEAIADIQEKPILFSGPLVRAILGGHKTQTRRVVKPQPYCPCDDPDLEGPGWYTPGVVDRDGILRPADEDVYGVWTYDGEQGWKCPYGAPGNHLWVREAFAFSSAFDDYSPSELYERYDKERKEIDALNEAGTNHTGRFTSEPDVMYRADESVRGSDMMKDFDFMRGRWRPSIHMPRQASRIQLEITDVRIERVQDITAREAVAEGIVHDASQDTYWGLPLPVVAFAELWDEINADRGYPWVDNPWVWVVSFRRVSS